MFKTTPRPLSAVVAPVSSGSAGRFVARSLQLGFLFAATFWLMLPKPVRSEVGAASQFRVGEVIVQLQPNSSVDAVNARNETTTKKRIAGTDYYLLGVGDDKREDEVLTQLEADSSVIAASLNRIVQSPFTSLSQSIMSFPDGYAVPSQPQTWYQLQARALDEQLSLTAAHMRSRGLGTTLAVIDTGIDRTHPSLAGHLWVDDRDAGDAPGNGIDEDGDGLVDDAHGWDFVDGDGDPTEGPDDPKTTVAGHGTFIAGLIAVLAPECRIIPIRAFTPQGESDEFIVAEAIKWAADHGADVINMSFGTPVNSSILRNAVEYAFQQNAILVAALGNEATDTPPFYPARYDDRVMGVAAVDSSDKVAFFSNYGPHASMSALGKSIISAYPGADYALWSGTSFSTPLVGAEAALLISADRNSRVTRLVIEQTALNIDGLNEGFAGLIGRGRLRPLHALKALNINTALNPILDLESTIQMTSAESPKARGRAEIFLCGQRQELRITAHGLAPGAAYRVIINGQPQPASCTAAAFGNIEVVMSTDPGVWAVVLADDFQPATVIDRVEICDEWDAPVLWGDFDPVLETAKPQQTLLKEAHFSGSSLSSGETASYATVSPIISGTARVEVDSKHQVLSIALETSTSNAIYTVVADGVPLGLVGCSLGLVSASFSSDGATGQSLPLGIGPLCNVRQVSILDSTGRVVARAAFLIVGANLGGG